MDCGEDQNIVSVALSCSFTWLVTLDWEGLVASRRQEIFKVSVAEDGVYAFDTPMKRALMKICSF